MSADPNQPDALPIETRMTSRPELRLMFTLGPKRTIIPLMVEMESNDAFIAAVRSCDAVRISSQHEAGKF
jgi:hypothetical protein